MRLGICVKGYFKGELFDVELPGRGAWRHACCEHISGMTEDHFDFDESHIVSWLIENPYSWGIDLPEIIVRKLVEVAPKDNDWLQRQIKFQVERLGIEF